MGPSDFRRGVAACAGSPRLLDFSFPTRCLQSPRGARRLRSSVASPTMAGFVQSGRLATPTLCNEAESSSIALRLAGSPRRASSWGLLLSTPSWLHVGHLFDMLITFQINREASLGLAHRNTRMNAKMKRHWKFRNWIFGKRQRLAGRVAHLAGHSFRKIHHQRTRRKRDFGPWKNQLFNGHAGIPPASPSFLASSVSKSSFFFKPTA